MKRYIIIFLFLILSANSINIFADDTTKQAFSDIKQNDWFYEAVNFCVDKNIIDGFNESQFEPFVAANREMFMTMLWRLDGEFDGYAMLPFEDIQHEWAKDAINWAYSNEIVNGYDNTHFQPLRVLSTEDLLTFLYRYTEYLNIDVNPLNYNIYEDPYYSTTSSYAMQAINWAVSHNIINKDGSQFKPQAKLSRAKLCYILKRYHDIILEGNDNLAEACIGEDKICKTITCTGQDDELICQIKDYATSIGKKPEDIGLYIENLNTGESFTLNPDKVFVAGSTYKLSLGMLYYDKIREGSVKLTDLYMFSKCDKEGGSTIGDTYPYGTYFNVDTLLTYMIIHSDNCAARILFRYAGGWYEFHRQAQKYSPNFDFYASSYKGNYITAHFSYDCLKHIYLNSQDYTMLLDDMKTGGGFYNASGLPVQIAQKPGYIGNNKHCVAIVYAKVPYIFSLYTTGGYNEWNLQQMNIIAYNYFNE